MDVNFEPTKNATNIAKHGGSQADVISLRKANKREERFYAET